MASMKNKRTMSSPISIPRSGSLLHRLQHAPEPEEGAQPYLDQLMIFLDDPPAGVRDRWKKGAKMCAAWGITCTHTSVWRLYRSYAIEWRQRLSHDTDFASNESSEALEERLAKLAVLRSIEMLANPNLSPECVIGLARIEQRKVILDFARERHEDKMDSTVDGLLAQIRQEVSHNRLARTAIDHLSDALKFGYIRNDESRPSTEP
jgi:hypothetical protein